MLWTITYIYHQDLRDLCYSIPAMNNFSYTSSTLVLNSVDLIESICVKLTIESELLGFGQLPYIIIIEGFH